MRRNLPGGAWFRHQARLAKQELGVKIDELPRDPNFRRWEREGEIQRSYALFTGGRAVSENLQLDRLLPGPRPDQKDETVPLDSHGTMASRAPRANSKLESVMASGSFSIVVVGR